MYPGRLVFSQIMDYLPREAFDRCTDKYAGDYRVRTFSCRSQLYHMGIRGGVSLNNLSNANMQRDWRIYAEFAQVLIDIARKLYADESFCDEISEPVYALDSTTITLSLSLFPWAEFRSTRGAVKLHTLMELPSSIPTFIDITEARPHDVGFLDRLLIEPGAYYVMDRGYVDFARLYRITRCGAFFVTRTKSNLRLKRRYSHDRDATAGILSDQTVVAEGDTFERYPAPLRRVRYRDTEQERTFAFLTNNFDLPAVTITSLYKARWQIELFFRWIKQHLRIKSFWGHSINAVKTQIWIAIAIYVLVAIIRKNLGLEHLTLYSILQVLSVSTFSYAILPQLLGDCDSESIDDNVTNQLSLFDL